MKKILLILLSAALCVGTLAGCGSSADSELQKSNSALKETFGEIASGAKSFDDEVSACSGYSDKLEMSLSRFNREKEVVQSAENKEYCRKASYAAFC